MKFLAFLLLAATAPLLPAETLRCAGVLGNSGEQGATLVRFGSPDVGGLGVVADSHGNLWDRAGAGVLNRYAWDGRQLGTYKIPVTSPDVYRDALVLLGDDTLLMNLGRRLYTLPANAPSGTAAVPLNVSVSHLSLDSAGGWAAANQGGEVFLINSAGEKKAVAHLAREPDLVEIGPDSTVYVGYFKEYKIYRIDPNASGSLVLVGGMPGERMQLMGDHWYGERFGGTFRRMNSNGEPDPGVIMGGGTGAFIGHAFVYPEIDQGCGMRQLMPDLFGISGGDRGILHLLGWSTASQQCTPIRRIGSVPSCGALGLDDDGNIFHFAGTWRWTDGPATPLANGVVAGSSAPNLRAAVTLPSQTMIAYTSLNGHASLYVGRLTGEVQVTSLDSSVGLLAPVAMTEVEQDGKLTLLTLRAGGEGQAISIDGTGHLYSNASPVQYKVNSPLQQWTALAALDSDHLAVAGDGVVVELERDGTDWKETQRWTSWDQDSTHHFGSMIYLAADSGRLWIADTDRHRVACFDAKTRRLLGVFGQVDKAGRRSYFPFHTAGHRRTRTPGDCLRFGQSTLSEAGTCALAV